jgi:glucose-1-phosphate adenylyltransferase
VFNEEGRRGFAVDAIIAGGSIISGGSVLCSIVGRGCRIHTGASVEESILFDNCDIGRHAKVRRAILDKNVKIPEGAEIGYDLEADRKKYYVTDSDIVVVEGHRSTVDIATIQV